LAAEAEVCSVHFLALSQASSVALDKLLNFCCPWTTQQVSASLPDLLARGNNTRYYVLLLLLNYSQAQQGVGHGAIPDQTQARDQKPKQHGKQYHIKLNTSRGSTFPFNSY